MVCPPHSWAPRVRPGLLLKSLLVASFLVGGAAAAETEPFVFSVEPDTLRADAGGMWTFYVRLQNRSDHGLYPDSLFVDWVSEDPADAGSTRQGTNPMSGLAHAMQPASAHDATGCSVNIPAEIARGRLTVRFLFHAGRDQSYTATHDVAVTGSDLDERFPSTRLDAGGRAAELVVMRADSSAWPAPGIVLLPAAGVRARSLVRWGLTLRERGYSLALLSPPGAGGSQGPDDHAGPASTAALNAAIARVGAERGFDAHRLVLWGSDIGATTALLVAARHPELKGVVAVNAEFDRVQAAKIAAPVLIVQTEEAGLAAGANAFVAARTERNLPVEARLNGLEARPVRRADATRLALDFVGRRTRQGGP